MPDTAIGRGINNSPCGVPDPGQYRIRQLAIQCTDPHRMWRITGIFFRYPVDGISMRVPSYRELSDSGELEERAAGHST